MIDQELEEKWWEAVRQQNDKKLFDRLYLSYWEKLYAIAWNRTKDEAVSKDIVQEIFISFWERRKDIVVRSTIAQYLSGALKNRLIDHFQSEQLKQRALSHALMQMDTILRQSDSARSYQDAEDILDDELNKMPDNMRRSFLLKLDNFSTSDIAKQLGLAEQTVSNLLTEASKRLHKNLPRRFQNKAMSALISSLQVIHDLLTKN